MANPLWTRRLTLTALTGVVALPFAELAGAADAVQARSGAARWLELFNTHTSEVVSVAFRDASGFVASALSKLEHVLRDHRAGTQHPIDTALYLQLSDLAAAAGREPRFEIISGYRSPVTNEQLRKKGGGGVARRSLHMEGRALDIRLKGCSCTHLRDVALEMRRGGVGYYARSNFVHIDTGRVRSWQG